MIQETHDVVIIDRRVSTICLVLHPFSSSSFGSGWQKTLERLNSQRMRYKFSHGISKKAQGFICEWRTKKQIWIDWGGDGPWPSTRPGAVTWNRYPNISESNGTLALFFLNEDQICFYWWICHDLFLSGILRARWWLTIFRRSTPRMGSVRFPS